MPEGRSRSVGETILEAFSALLMLVGVLVLAVAPLAVIIFAVIYALFFA